MQERGLCAIPEKQKRRTKRREKKHIMYLPCVSRNNVPICTRPHLYEAIQTSKMTFFLQLGAQE